MKVHKATTLTVLFLAFTACNSPEAPSSSPSAPGAPSAQNSTSGKDKSQTSVPNKISIPDFVTKTNDCQKAASEALATIQTQHEQARELHEENLKTVAQLVQKAQEALLGDNTLNKDGALVVDLEEHSLGASLDKKYDKTRTAFKKKLNDLMMDTISKDVQASSYSCSQTESNSFDVELKCTLGDTSADGLKNGSEVSMSYDAFHQVPVNAAYLLAGISNKKPTSLELNGRIYTMEVYTNTSVALFADPNAQIPNEKPMMAVFIRNPDSGESEFVYYDDGTLTQSFVNKLMKAAIPSDCIAASSNN